MSDTNLGPEVVFATPPLGLAEESVISQIDNLRNKLRRQLSEPQRWFGSLRRLSFARAIQGSNSIEGFQADLDDAAAAADGEEPIDVDWATRQALFGYRQAMT